MAETKKIVKASEGYHLTPLNLSKGKTEVSSKYYKPFKYLNKIKITQQGGVLSYLDFAKKYGKDPRDKTYNLKRAYEIYKESPETFEGGLANMQVDGWHFSSVDPATGIFLKRKDNPTINKELDWYNYDGSSEAFNQRMTKDLDTSGEFYKYVDKGKGTKIPFK